MAGPPSDALSRCLADNTTGRDRKELARWVFVAMAAHPEIQDLAGQTGKAREDTSRYVGGLVTRLLTESCTQEARTAFQSEGSAAFKVAFGSLGQLAMQELMTNPQVSSSFSNIEKYVDQKKLAAISGGK